MKKSIAGFTTTYLRKVVIPQPKEYQKPPNKKAGDPIKQER